MALTSKSERDCITLPIKNDFKGPGYYELNK